MAAIAGARRTVSSPARFAADARTPDLVTDVDEAAFDGPTPRGPRPSPVGTPGFEAFIADVDALPGVAGTSLSDAVAVARVADGVPDLTFPGQAFVSVDGDRYFRTDRIALSDGRMPDPDEPLEVLINETMARARNLAPGDRLQLDGLSAEGVERFFGSGELDSFPLDLRVTGVGRLTEEALFDQLGDEQRMILTPAFAAEHDVGKMFSRLAVHLEPGADRTAVMAAILDTAGPAGRGFLFEDRGRVEERVQLAVRPYGLFVAGLGAIVAAFTLALAGQAAARVIGGLGPDVASLRALGLGRRRTILALLVAPLAATLVGAVVATVVAVVASPQFPIGPTRASSPTEASTWTRRCCSPAWRCASSRSSVVPPWPPRWCPGRTFPPIRPAPSRSHRGSPPRERP